jgi:hypothetical protein
MSDKRKNGIGLILLGVIMFFVAIDQFTYRGNEPFVNVDLAEICFVLWLPTIIYGIVLIALSYV